MTDFVKILGQEHCKRALEVAAVGRHSVLLIGTLAAGKSTLLKAFAGITDRKLHIIEELPDQRRNTLLKNVEQLENEILCATMLPCPCGHFTDPKAECRCTPHQIQNYLNKLPGFVLDRLQIHIEVPRLNLAHLSGRRVGENTAAIKERVINAQLNARPKDMDKDAEELLKLAILELGISARAYDKIEAVATTIAQMDGKAMIEAHHISEAISYRSLDRNLWG